MFRQVLAAKIIFAARGTSFSLSPECHLALFAASPPPPGASAVRKHTTAAQFASIATGSFIV